MIETNKPIEKKSNKNHILIGHKIDEKTGSKESYGYCTGNCGTCWDKKCQASLLFPGNKLRSKIKFDLKKM